jgi:dihydroorotate dehydrogenase (NAD+) catalytic subunit
MVWQVASTVSIPVIGIGGITTAEDAMEFIIAGATAVQVGTANFFRPLAALEIIEGMRSYLQKQGIAHIRELRGSLQLPVLR